MQEAEPVTPGENTDISRRFSPGADAHPPASRAQAKPAGEPSVDALIARLDGLDALSLDGHVAVFEDTHAGLRQVLSELDAAPDAGPQPGPGGR
jgi:hypothetical protein